MVFRVRVGTKFVKYVDEDRLDLTSDREEAGFYSFDGSIEVERLVRKHMPSVPAETLH